MLRVCFGLLALLLMGNTANAQSGKRLECTLFLAVMNKLQYPNNGAIINAGPSVWSIPQCNYKWDETTTLYVFSATFLPFSNFKSGGETDLGLGFIKRWGDWSLDVRFADYYFSTLSGIVNELNYRGRLGYTFKLHPNVTVEAYGLYDEQWATTSSPFRARAVAAGAVLSLKLTQLFLEPTFTADFQHWDYFDSPFANKSITTVVMQLAFPLLKTGCSMGPRVVPVWGTPGNRSEFNMTWGAFTVCPF